MRCDTCTHYTQPRRGVGNFGLCSVYDELVLGEWDECDDYDPIGGIPQDDDVILDEREW